MAGGILPCGYAELCEDLKGSIRGARRQAALAVNSELVLLHGDIGQAILEGQRDEGLGAKVMDALAQDLQREFPRYEGFLPAKSQGHTRPCPSLPLPEISPGHCSPIALGPQCDYSQKAQGAARAATLPGGLRRSRLEPRGSGAPDGKRSVPPQTPRHGPIPAVRGAAANAQRQPPLGGGTGSKRGQS